MKPLASGALPTGGKVVSGAASINQSGTSLTVTQKSAQLVATWDAFNIGTSAGVQFVQPGAQSVALNRVIGSDASQIEGKLVANGQVFLINPNGIIFSKNAHVDVGGIVATTLALADADFLSGHDTLESAGTPASIENDGAISAASGGYVVLAAPRVRNSGQIDAPHGSVAVAAGSRVAIAIGSAGLLSVSVDAAAMNALAQNSGVLRSDGGLVQMSARTAGAQLAVVAAGTIQAHSIAQRAGRIFLDGGSTGSVQASGMLDAASRESDSPGGQVSITGQVIELTATAVVNVSGTGGGGVIEVGGGLHGGGSLRHATQVSIAKGATLNASANESGNGGSIAIWSDGTTQVAGALQARGAGRNGTGGLIETSGHSLTVTGISVDASSPLGKAGTWLLDPYDLTVTASATSITPAPTGTWTSGAGGSNVLNADINDALNSGTAVVLQTSGSLADGFGAGNITVSAPILKTAGAATSLTLQAAGSIVVNSAISSISGALAVTLDANTLLSGGYVNIAAPITTLGGALVIGGGATPASAAAVGTAVQASGVRIADVLDTGGADVVINGGGQNSTGNANIGIVVAPSGAILSRGGGVTLLGTGGGSGLGEHGIFIDSGALVSGAGGDVSITGAASPFGTGSGVYLSGAASTVSTAGTGTVSINGSAAGSGAEMEYGVYLGAGSIVSAADGLASLTGSNDTTSTISGQVGVNIVSGASVVSSGIGGVTVVGTGGGEDTTGADLGVSVGAAGGIQATLLGGNSPITIVGVGGDAGGSGAGNVGVQSLSAVVGNGGVISITGTGGAASGGTNIGIQMDAVSNTGAGAITIKGTGGSFAAGVNGSNTGVNLAGAVTATSGAILLSGTAGNTAGGSNVGISVQAAITATGDGDITLLGAGNGTGVSEHGVYINGNTISSQGGAVAVTGFATTRAAGIGSGIYFFGPASTVSTTGSGGVDVTGYATGGASEVDYGVYLGNASSVISAVNGLITVTGTNSTTSSTTGQIGVDVVAGAIIKSSGTGGISVTGTGGGRDTTGGDYGILVSGASGIRATLAAGNSPITITGTGGDSGGTGSGNYGVNSAALTGNGGPINIIGSGGNSSGAFNYGIAYSGGITNTGAGTIGLLGTGGGTGTSEFGVYVNASTIAAAGGNVTVTGFGAPLGTGSGVYMTGAGSKVSATGIGTVTVDGTGTGSGAQNVYGVNLGNSSSMISTVNGLVTVIGTNTATSTTTGQIGVNIASGATIKSGGTGGITVVGVGGGSDSTGTDYGIFAPGVNAIQATLAAGNSAINITGTGGDINGSGVSNYGVFSQGALAGNGGAIRITGTGGNSSGNSNFGINYLGAISNTGTGSITLNGTGGGTGISERGVTINAATVSAGGGNVSVTGTGSAVGTGSGVYLTGAASSISTIGMGNVTVSGTAKGGGAQANYGVFVGTSTSLITAVNGAISVTGTNATTSATGGQLGVNIVSGAAVRTSGTGAISIIGTGGGRDATGGDDGVFIGAGNGIQTTLAGGNSAITVLGTGGDTGGLGGSNDGVHLLAALTGNGGNISISGVPGNSAGSGNLGLSLTTVAAGAATLTLTSTGATAISDAVTAANLALLGTGGSFTLTNAGNATTTFAAQTGNINYSQAADLSIGTVGATTGVTSSGSVLVNVGGDLTLASGARVSAVGSTNALQLVDGGRFTNNAGANAFSVSGGGRYLVWSVTPTNDTRGGLAPGFIQYGATFASTLPLDATHDGLLYSMAGVVSVVLAAPVSKIYDTTDVASLVAANYTTSGVLGGDTLILNNPTAGTYDNIHIGTGKTVTVAGLSIVSAANAGAAVYGYTLLSTTASSPVGRIAAAALNVALTGSVSKVYDTTDAAALQASNYVLTGVLAGDVVSLNNPAVGTFDSIHVGAGKTVNVAGLALSGANAADYLLIPTTVAGPIGVITAAFVTAGLGGTVSKVYDGTAAAVVSAANYTLSGVLGSDVVILNDPGAGTYDDIHVGNNKLVNVGGLVISGANSGDYLLANDAVSVAIGFITPRPLTVTADPESRLYGVANPPLTYQATSGSLVNGDLLSGAPATTATALSNVGAYAITRGTLASTSDYALSFMDGTLSVGQQQITLVAASGQGKIYGANDPMSASAAYTLTGGALVNGDLITGNMGRTPGELVGNYSFTRGSTSVADDNGGANYLITFDGTSHPFAIARASLGATLADAAKVYGADDPLVGGMNPILTGLVNRTVSDINGASTLIDDTGRVAATLATLTRGAGEGVGSYGITAATFGALTGAAAGNYDAPTLNGAPKLAISAAPLNAGITNQSKVYGADDPALAGIAPSLTGLISRTVSTWNGGVVVNDTAAVSAALASLTRAAGEALGSYDITAATFRPLSGTASANYETPILSGVPALAITAAPLRASIANQTKVYGADDPALSGIAPLLSGLINRTVSTWNGSVAIDDTAAVSVGLASLGRAGGEARGSYDITAATFHALTGAAAGNYASPTLSGIPTLAITAAPLSASIANQTKTYGADDPALSGITPLLSGLVNRTVNTWNGGVAINDTAAVSSALASLSRTAGEDVGSYGITGATFSALGGTSALNYSIPVFSGVATLAISAAPLGASIANQTKVYGSDDPGLSGITAALSGVIDRTVSTWNGAVTVNDTAAVETAVNSLTRTAGEDVGSYDITAATFDALTGAAALNYGLPTLQGAARLAITAAPLGASVANQSKVYGTDDPLLAGVTTSLNGLINRAVSTWNGGVMIDDSSAVSSALAALTRTTGEAVGSYAITAATLQPLSGASAGNYDAPALTGVATLSISVAPLSTSIANQTKIYGADDPALSGIKPLLSGLIDRAVATWNGSVLVDDTLAVSSTLTSLTRAVGENVGNYGVTGAIFHALVGTAAANYAAPDFSGAPTLAITRASSVAMIADQARVYGNADPLAASIAVTLVPIDRAVATWNGAAAIADAGKVTATLASISRQVGENVGRYDYTTGTLAALGGSSAANYTTGVIFSNSPTLLITPRALSVSALAANDKIYDSTSVARLSGGVLSGIVRGDTVALTGGAASFADDNAGSDKQVTARDFALAGVDSGNYTLNPVTGLTANILPAALTVTALANTKSFDGNTAARAIPSVSGLQGSDTALTSETYGNSNIGTSKTLNPLAAISDGNGGANYKLILIANTDGVITAMSLPPSPVSGGEPYVPVAGGRGDGDGNDAGPVVLPPRDGAAALQPLLTDTGTDASLADLTRPALYIRTSLDTSGDSHTVLAGGQVYLVTYSDGSSSSISVTDGHDRSMRFAVPESSRAMRLTFPVAEHAEIFARATVHSAGGRVSVTLNRASGTLPAAASIPEASVKHLDVRMTGSDNTELRFALSFADGLSIEPRNATAAAALLGSTRNESLLDLVLAEAIVKVADDWQVGAVPSARLEH